MTKPTYVLGTGLSHDGSACLLKDGEIRFAIEKERVTRIKHDGGGDSEAIRYCLNAEGIKLNDLSLIVQNANFGAFEYGNAYYKTAKRILDEKCQVPVVTISHHLAHAYSALAMSPFEEMGILVIDGCGSAFDEVIDNNCTVDAAKPASDCKHLWFEKDSFYLYRGGRL
ncbi:MAG TPA: carbamoyltransferase N-terminal domain-containing protein, partial [Opitutaceae bacterium]|nr:carbamoyltransferase N-terminal domain-containing protein [Opitutaceae bacterium]